MAEWGDRVETEQRLKGQRTDHRTDCRRDDRDETPPHAHHVRRPFFISS